MAKKYKYRHKEKYKDVTIDCKADTKASLMAKVQKKKDEIDRNTISPDMRLLPFALQYLETYRKLNVSKQRYATLESIVKNKIVEGIGNKKLSKIKPIEIQSFINTLSCYTTGYIKMITSLTKTIFGHAYKNGLTAVDLTATLITPKGREDGTGRSLTDYEVEVLMEVLKDNPRGKFFKMMYYCGLRPGEVAALLWKDIDLDKRTVSVNKAVKRDGYVGSPKSKAGYRDVPIPEVFARELVKGNPFDRFCTSKTGKAMRRDLILQEFDKIKRDMNIKMGAKVINGELVPPLPLNDFRAYDLRHTYCTNLEKAGVPINIASRLMGHSDITITSRIYTHPSDEAIDIARKLIDSGNQSGKNPVSVEI